MEYVVGIISDIWDLPASMGTFYIKRRQLEMNDGVGAYVDVVIHTNI